MKTPSPAGGSSRQSAEGFGLLEVLVATTLMGVMLVVLLQVLTSALRAQEASLHHIRALLVAEKVLQENSNPPSLAAATYQGREGNFDYRVQIAPQFELANPMVNKKVVCSIIQVTVYWQERGQTKSLGLETIRTIVQKST